MQISMECHMIQDDGTVSSIEGNKYVHMHKLIYVL